MGVGHQRLQGDRSHQRHVAVEHQYDSIVGNGRQRLADRVAGAQLLRLLHPVNLRRIGERRFHGISAMTVDHAATVGTKAAGGFQHMSQHRFTADRMQYLGKIRDHPFAFAGGKNDHS